MTCNVQKTAKVTIIIPMRNEEKYIGKCLDSIVVNDYPKDKLEILAVDGKSEDRTREIVEKYAEEYLFVKLLDNKNVTAPSALNIGIGNANGEIVIRMDAHATYASDYISQCVELLQTHDAANVGGVQRAVGERYISSCIAAAMMSRFGVGDAKFHYSSEQEWVDTVYLGAWHKRTLEELGGFNEDWVVNQDYELNYRLRKAGGNILLSPGIRCQYYVRSSLAKLARQYFRYGFWKVKTLRAHPDSLRWRQLAPPLFVLALVASLALVWVWWPASLIVPGLYVAANFIASLLAARRSGWHYLPLLPVIFTMLHLCWGAGFWSGLLRFGIPRLSLRSVSKAFRRALVVV